MKKKLVIYFSITGNSKEVAKYIKEITQGDSEEIRSKTNFAGKLGYIKACFFAIRKKSSPIEKLINNPAKYSEIILVTPVWAGTISGPVRAYIEKYSKKINLMSIITVSMSPNPISIKSELLSKYGANINTQVEICNKSIKDNSFKKKLEEKFK